MQVHVDAQYISNPHPPDNANPTSICCPLPLHREHLSAAWVALVDHAPSPGWQYTARNGSTAV